MDTLNWKIIAELHRTGNITRAADRLFMTQPALSKRLQMIERDLGTRLVVRTAKGVSFTAEGEYVAQEAAKILEHFTKIQTNLLSFGDRLSGTIQLGMTNSFVRYTLPSHLKAYKARFSGTEFGITADVSSQIVEKVEGGDIHVGFICGDLDGNFKRALIGKDQACLVNNESIDLCDLPFRPQISYLSDPFAIRMLEGWWRSHFSTAPLTSMRANHGDTCLEMIANGLGYGIFLSPKFIGNSRSLFRMPLHYADGTPFARNSWMIWKDEFSNIPFVNNFLEYMRTKMTDDRRL